MTDKIKINYEDRMIEIQTHLPHYVYEIDLDTCRSHEQKMDWIQHLKGKNWFTNEYLIEFLEVIKTIK